MPGELVRATLPLRRAARRQPGLAPRLEAADHVAGPRVAQVDERRGGEDRRAAVVAEQDQLPVEAADVRVAPRPVGRRPPLEHGAGDVQRPGHDAVALAIVDRADVDQERACVHRRDRLRRGMALDSRLGLREEVVQRPRLRSRPGHAPWHCFHLRPEPQVQGSLRPRLASSAATTPISSAGARFSASRSAISRIGRSTWWKKSL